jgi:predicted metalloprotease
MAQWNKLGSRGDIQDRRGMGNTARIGGGAGIAGIALIVLVNYLNGGDIIDVLPQLQEQLQIAPQQNISPEDFAGADEYEVFTATVLGSVNDMWTQVFAQNNTTYSAPALVLFREGTNSACGGADSATGPHYCPVDQTIYLDETFFEELQTRFGGNGGDVAQAYVIAHEVAHHVQYELGIIDGSARDNDTSIKTELQADCFAGLWAHSIKDRGVFEPNEIQEALSAAAAVGDDRIQESTTGRINPELWTHGSSEDRMRWFTAGYEQGIVSACNM